MLWDQFTALVVTVYCITWMHQFKCNIGPQVQHQTSPVWSLQVLWVFWRLLQFSPIQYYILKHAVNYPLVWMIVCLDMWAGDGLSYIQTTRHSFTLTRFNEYHYSMSQWRVPYSCHHEGVVAIPIFTRQKNAPTKFAWNIGETGGCF